jgi:hypothetical protein
VVVEGEAAQLGELGGFFQNFAAEDGVLADDGDLFVAEAAGLVEDVVGDADLADVV